MSSVVASYSPAPAPGSSPDPTLRFRSSATKEPARTSLDTSLQGPQLPPNAALWLSALARGCRVPLQTVPTGAGARTGAGAICRRLGMTQGWRPDCERRHDKVRQEALAAGRLSRGPCVLGLWMAALPVQDGKPVPWGVIECGPLADPEQTEADFVDHLNRLGLEPGERDKVLNAWRQIPPHSPEEAEGLMELLQRVAVVVGEELQRDRVQAVAHEPAAVVVAKHHVAAHLAESLPLARVAREVGLTADHFSRVFRRTQGVAFGEYVNACRIARARELLGDSAQRVIEVAYACGFESVSHFNRVFRRAVGSSPTEYRRTVRGRA